MRVYKQSDFYKQTQKTVKKSKRKSGRMWRWSELGPTDMKKERSHDTPTDVTMRRAIALCAEKCPWTKVQVGHESYIIAGVRYTSEQVKAMRNGETYTPKKTPKTKTDAQQIRYWRA